MFGDKYVVGVLGDDCEFVLVGECLCYLFDCCFVVE